jgi:hypothetical protein
MEMANMKDASPRPSIAHVLERFAAYRRREPAWGCLHIVLDDGNTDDDSVRFCVGYAEEHDDFEAAALARVLLQMSRTQRKKLHLRLARGES